jgi:hypothetical protein
MQQTDAAELKALVESLDDAQIMDQVQMRIEHDQLIDEMATMALTAFAAVQLDLQSDGSLDPAQMLRRRSAKWARPGGADPPARTGRRGQSRVPRTAGQCSAA